MRDDLGDLQNRFNHHIPTPEKVEKHRKIREHSFNLAREIVSLVPESRERSLALTKLEEFMFWANAGVARSET